MGVLVVRRKGPNGVRNCTRAVLLDSLCMKQLEEFKRMKAPHAIKGGALCTSHAPAAAATATAAKAPTTTATSSTNATATSAAASAKAPTKAPATTGTARSRPGPGSTASTTSSPRHHAYCVAVVLTNGESVHKLH